MRFQDQVEIRDGFVWPKSDDKVFPIAMQEVLSVPEYAKRPKQRRSVIQAGGNCGVFANAYSSLFEKVYTFEPDPLNFFCLTQNASTPNVVKYQAALGCDRDLIEVFPLYEDNIAGFGVRTGGYIPVLRVDDLGIKDCDLLQLDVEGSEFGAVLGARETIMRCRPVIILEVKPLPGGFGVKPSLIFDYLLSIGYEAAGRWGDDEVFIYKAG